MFPLVKSETHGPHSTKFVNSKLHSAKIRMLLSRFSWESIAFHLRCIYQLFPIVDGLILLLLMAWQDNQHMCYRVANSIKRNGKTANAVTTLLYTWSTPVQTRDMCSYPVRRTVQTGWFYAYYLLQYLVKIERKSSEQYSPDRLQWKKNYETRCCFYGSYLTDLM